MHLFSSRVTRLDPLPDLLIGGLPPRKDCCATAAAEEQKRADDAPNRTANRNSSADDPACSSCGKGNEMTVQNYVAPRNRPFHSHVLSSSLRSAVSPNTNAKGLSLSSEFVGARSISISILSVSPQVNIRAPRGSGCCVSTPPTATTSKSTPPTKAASK